MKPEIVPASAGHIPAIAAHVRAADRDELWAMARHTPEQAMEQALEISEMAWTGLIDGMPVCMFGVVPSSILGNTGRPWMVGTTHLDAHPLVFLRRCMGCVGRMGERFDRLENYVDARNTRAIQWLMWLGFTFGEPEPMGAYGLPFKMFWMEVR